MELDYETKRGQLSLYFDSVKVCVCRSAASTPLPETFSLTCPFILGFPSSFFSPAGLLCLRGRRCTVSGVPLDRSVTLLAVPLLP